MEVNGTNISWNALLRRKNVRFGKSTTLPLRSVSINARSIIPSSKKMILALVLLMHLSFSLRLGNALSRLVQREVSGTKTLKSVHLWLKNVWIGNSITSQPSCVIRNVMLIVLTSNKLIPANVSHNSPFSIKLPEAVLSQNAKARLFGTSSYWNVLRSSKLVKSGSTMTLQLRHAWKSVKWIIPTLLKMILALACLKSQFSTRLQDYASSLFARMALNGTSIFWNVRLWIRNARVGRSISLLMSLVSTSASLTKPTSKSMIHALAFLWLQSLTKSPENVSSQNALMARFGIKLW